MTEATVTGGDVVVVEVVDVVVDDVVLDVVVDDVVGAAVVVVVEAPELHAATNSASAVKEIRVLCIRAIVGQIGAIQDYFNWGLCPQTPTAAST
ncbi:MAG: hypothetical protein GEU79_01735 [Acidimicrobiia bacterium]|nr:hypothetical protein [Acidimicrobiia bacterium]